MCMYMYIPVPAEICGKMLENSKEVAAENNKKWGGKMRNLPGICGII